MRRKFLTARWCNLVLANFAVPEELLRPLVPPGCELDRRDGACWASLVGFQFLGTRVLGIGWPGFRNFPEWNLRFYVTGPAPTSETATQVRMGGAHTAPTSETATQVRMGGAQRGVCFVREFVPQWSVATVARVLYNEPYRSARMSMDVKDAPDTLTATYTVKWGDRVHSLRAVGAKPAVRPTADSLEHWFKEHSWGYGTSRRGKLIRYEVNHPEWDVYPVTEFAADVDWALMYGPEWAPMNGVPPASVVLAVGSEISVYPKG